MFMLYTMAGGSILSFSCNSSFQVSMCIPFSGDMLKEQLLLYNSDMYMVVWMYANVCLCVRVCACVCVCVLGDGKTVEPDKYLH